MNSLSTRFKKLKNRKGFTLVELIVVIVIIGILAAIVIPKLSGFRATAQEKAVMADAKTITTAVASLIADGNTDIDQTDIETLTGDLHGTVAVGDIIESTGVITFTYTDGSYVATVTDSSIPVMN